MLQFADCAGDFIIKTIIVIHICKTSGSFRGGAGASVAACIMDVGVASGVGLSAESPDRCWLLAAIAWPWTGGGVLTSSVNKQNHVYPAVKLETCHGLIFGLENQHYGIEIGHLKYQLASIVILHIEVQNIFFAVRNQFSSEVYSWCSCTT